MRCSNTSFGPVNLPCLPRIGSLLSMISSFQHPLPRKKPCYKINSPRLLISKLHGSLSKWRHSFIWKERNDALFNNTQPTRRYLWFDSSLIGANLYLKIARVQKLEMVVGHLRQFLNFWGDVPCTSIQYLQQLGHFEHTCYVNLCFSFPT